MATSVDEKLGTLLGRQRRVERQTEAAEKESRRQSEIQQQKIAEQETQEKRRLAEATSEVEERRARAKRAGGRSLLIKTSPRGVQSLGGV